MRDLNDVGKANVNNIIVKRLNLSHTFGVHIQFNDVCDQLSLEKMAQVIVARVCSSRPTGP